MIFLIGEVLVKRLFEFSAGFVVLISTIGGLLFRSAIKNYHNVLLFFDSIGLGFFTVVGIQTGISLDMHPISCIALGTITADFEKSLFFGKAFIDAYKLQDEL